MNSTRAQQNSQTQHLMDAFQQFNVLSENLSKSYQSLENQVAQLHSELSAAHSERLQTLMEKEKIATRLQQLVAALPAAVIVLNADEYVIDCNQLAIDLIGEPLIGIDWPTIIRQRLLPIFDSPDERQIADGRRVHIKRNYLSNDAGQLILLSDVTELRALQDVLVQQKHLSAMGEMVAAMAHQVRTPLSTAILYASQMNKPAVSEEKRQSFSTKILQRLHHMERQVNDMLIYAKQGRLTMEEFSLSAMLQTIQENMSTRKIRFELENHVEIDALQGNQHALQGALMNLLNNAVEACGEMGAVSLEVSRVDTSSITFVIQDNGVGMNAQQQQRLFEPFFTTKNEGTGLGLAIVESVLLAHRGKINCQSDVGRGSKFTIILPCIGQDQLTIS